MVNVWNAYQCMATFNMSRSASFYESGIGRGLGFRDSNRTLLGFVQMVPERARERILDLAATQLPRAAPITSTPLTKKGNNDIGGNFNDDPHWLIIGVGGLPERDRRLEHFSTSRSSSTTSRAARKRCMSTCGAVSITRSKGLARMVCR